MAKTAQKALAIDGGPKACPSIPPRGLFDCRERDAVNALFDQAIAKGSAFGYNGAEEEAYCKELAQYLGGGYVDAVNSGTTAVYVALRALELEPFTEVIVSPVTDPGGVMPVPLCGCVPIPADSMPGSYNVGPDGIEARITKRTSAIIVAHIAGIPAPMGPIMEIAKARNIPVIEDCAQAHGATWAGKLVGTWGTLGAFSTMSGKHHATGAQGGAVFTHSEEMYWRIRRHSDRGKPFGMQSATNVVCALNHNLNDLAACIGRVQLKKLPRIVAKRQVAAHKLAEACRSLKSIRMVDAPPKGKSVYWFLFFQLDTSKLRVDKTTFVKALAAEGVPADASYFHFWPEAAWYKMRAVFGTSGLPWSSPLYKGDSGKEYPCPNIRAADAAIFRMGFHENFDAATVRRIAAAFGKVEAAYLK